MAKTGIGIITRDRLCDLRQTVKAIERYTPNEEYDLIVADDGSTDGTREWLSRQGIACISGPTGCVARNRNRLLLYWQEKADWDTLIILDDDARPFLRGWLGAWRAFAEAHGFGGYHAADFPPGTGQGTVADPYRDEGAGCALAISRSVFEFAGYFSPDFYAASPSIIWGYEDAEWAGRARQFNRPLGLTGPLSLNFGIEHNSPSPRWVTQGGLNQGREIFQQKSGGHVFVWPWRGEMEKASLLREIDRP